LQDEKTIQTRHVNFHSHDCSGEICPNWLCCFARVMLMGRFRELGHLHASTLDSPSLI
jgi:hypothetical protein